MSNFRISFHFAQVSEFWHVAFNLISEYHFTVRDSGAYFQLGGGGGLHPGREFVGVSGAILPQKILKSKMSSQKVGGGGGGVPPSLTVFSDGIIMLSFQEKNKCLGEKEKHTRQTSLTKSKAHVVQKFR